MRDNLISGLPLFKRGKVRDIYDLGDRLLMVASDRISCFDVVLPTEIPGKGKILIEKPIFTPSTKAPAGEHDENITVGE